MSGYRSDSFAERGIVFVSFFTPNYAEYAKRLVESLQKFGVEYDIREVKRPGGWQGAVRSKPGFIRDMLNEHPQAKVLVWVDADAELRHHPEVLCRLRCGIACPVRLWVHKQVKELICNVMFFSNVPKVKEDVDRWIEGMTTVPADCETPEQVALAALVWPAAGSKGLRSRFLSLPSDFSFHLTDRQQRATFWQYQVSRQHNPQQIEKRKKRAQATTEAQERRDKAKRQKEEQRAQVRAAKHKKARDKKKAREHVLKQRDAEGKDKARWRKQIRERKLRQQRAKVRARR